MKVARDRDSKTRRGLDRFFIIASTEHRAGLVPAKKIRKDDAGQHFATQKAALAYAKKLQAQIDAGANPSNTAGRTFGDALDRHYTDLDRKQADGEGTAVHYDAVRSRLSTHVEAFTLRGVPICRVPLSTIDVDLVETDLVPQIRNEKHTANFQRKLLQDLRVTFQHAIDVKWIASNPTRKVKISVVKTASQKRSAEDPLAREAYQRLLDAWSAHIAWVERLVPTAVLPIQLAAQTGVRAGELTAITPAQIGHNTGQLIIDRAWKKVERCQAKVCGLPKSGKARAVGLSSHLLARLSEHQLANGIGRDATLFGTTDHAPWRRAWQRAQFAVAGWLLLHSGRDNKVYRLFKLTGDETDEDIWKLVSWADGQRDKPLHSRREDGIVFKTLAEAAAHAGITLLTWHDLRHLYCSVLFKNDEPIGRITEKLGHSSEAVTRKHYKEWITDPGRDADEAERVAAAFG